MKDAIRIVIGSLFLGTSLFMAGCVVAPPPAEGYYDHDHHRWWHEHSWVNCGPNDEHCR